MTEQLDKALAVIRRMPAAEQDTIAETMMSLARIGEPLDEIEPEYRAAVMEGMAAARRGEFAEGTASEIVARAFQHPCP